ncbi:AAA family ATPase [Aestuariibius sp. 2305UL40-4]|uniref:AAA family ATPase n=1 Tax=Aestuariibius violaceus TaxID=3234132 RepID=UPI003472A70B
MDQIHWKPGWIERDPDEKSAMTHAIHIQDRWILEGGHSRTYPERVARADTFIWLDLPVGLRVARVLYRSARYYGQTRPDLPDGCPEQLNRSTIEFLAFIWRTRRTARAKLEAIASAARPDLTIIHLKTPRDVARWLATVKR